MYNAMDVARYCIWYCSHELGQPISNLQLQKILYYIQGAFLAETGEPAFSEDILSWRYGPVVENVYRNYRIFTSDKITPTSDYDKNEVFKNKEIIEKICESKSKKTGNQLISNTHSEAPWQRTKGDGSVMTNDELKEFFSSDEGKQRLEE